MIFAMLAMMGVSMSGCAAHNYRAAVPGCKAWAYVPKDCYAQSFADHLEVRCADKTTNFRCDK